MNYHTTFVKGKAVTPADAYPPLTSQMLDALLEQDYGDLLQQGDLADTAQLLIAWETGFRALSADTLRKLTDQVVSLWQANGMASKT